MGNIFASLFNFASSTQIENTTVHAQIDTLIERIKKDFSEGNFSQAFESLDSSLIENDNNKEAKYKLLLVKLKFLIDCRKFKEANELISVLDKEKKDDLKFNELKLTMMSLNNNNNYLTFAEELRIKTPKSIPKGHFKILYYLNTKQFEKAKEVFEEEIKNDTYKHKLYLVGGHLYSNEYRYFDVGSDNYDKADYFYKLAIEHSELDFLEKLQINGFYATYFMNNHLRNKAENDDLKEKLIEYKTSLKIVIDSKEYFEKSYLNSLIDNYLFALISLGLTEEYITFYESNKDDSNMRHYLTYCSFKSLDIDHMKCQENILKNAFLDNILVYISLVVDTQGEDRKIVLEFFNENKELIYKDKFIILVYIKGLIQFNMEIDEELIDFVINKKYEHLEYILAYFEISLYLGTKITDEDNKKLLDIAKLENLTLMRLYQAVEMLYRIKTQEKYLNLVIEKQHTFKSLVPKILEDICYNDKDLLLTDFNEFVKQIDENLYARIIGNIYIQHNDIKTAFEYFYIDFTKNKDISLAVTMIYYSMIYYNNYTQNINIIKQNKVFNFLLGKLDELEIDFIITIFGYSVNVNSDTSMTFPYINQYLLKENIKELNEETKNRFASIHFETWLNIHKDLYKKTMLIDTNLCLIKDGKIYIKDMYEVNDENIQNYGFINISEDDYNLKKQDERYEESSLFHRITGLFAYECDLPNMVKMDIKKDHSELYNLIEEVSKDKKNTFKNFSNGETITFYNLAEKDYKKYFSLIPKLLNDNNHDFDSGKYNHQPNKTPKLLTFTSIILLNEINYLDEILKRKDIFIQRTLMRFLLEYKDGLENNSELIPKFDSNECQFIFFLETAYYTERDRLISLINKLIKHENIIEDYDYFLPIKESKNRLAENLGLQEYHALAYSYKNNYQIITEDRTFNHLFQGFNFNLTMLSNSIVLLEDLLSIDDLNSLKIELHQKKYRPLIEDKYLETLKTFMTLNDINSLYKSEKDFLKFVVNDYGILEELKEKYAKTFDIRLPLLKPPTKTHFATNIEKLIKIIESN